MTIKKRARKAKMALDTKPYIDLVRQTREEALKALDSLGDSTLSLTELRQKVDQELQGQSVSEWLLQERKAGW